MKTEYYKAFETVCYDTDYINSRLVPKSGVHSQCDLCSVMLNAVHCLRPDYLIIELFDGLCINPSNVQTAFYFEGTRRK